MTTPGAVSAGSFADAFLAALDLAPLPRPTICVLDVGTGTARIPIEICTRQSGIDIIGVDRRPGILQRARRDIHRARIRNVVCVHRADACALPYADLAFDAVISNSLLHHLPRRLDTLREMVRVLRPGGVLLVRDSLRQPDAETIARILSRSAAGTAERRQRVPGDTHPVALTLDEARELAKAAGLPPEWVRPTGSRHWLINGRRPDLPGVLHAALPRPTL